MNNPNNPSIFQSDAFVIDPRTNEEMYDQEIAPKLALMAKACAELGFSFACQVEYPVERRAEAQVTLKESGEPTHQAGITAILTSDATWTQRLVLWAMQCAGNIDSLIITCCRYVRKNNMNYSASIVLRWFMRAALDDTEGKTSKSAEGGKQP